MPVRRGTKSARWNSDHALSPHVRVNTIPRLYSATQGTRIDFRARGATPPATTVSRANGTVVNKQKGWEP